MKKILSVAAVLAVFLGLSATSYADVITGKVKDINTNDNTLTLVGLEPESNEAREYKITWDDDLVDIDRIERARVGQLLSVTADKGLVGAWEVKSVSGRLASAENAFLRTNERIISGDVTSIDVKGNVMMLASKDFDKEGRPINYRIVWEDHNTDVRERLEDADIGDTVSVIADRNVITQNWRAKSLPARGDAREDQKLETIAGEVKSIDTDKNVIVLNAVDNRGRVDERKIVWDDDFAQTSRLESVQPGQRITVRADQNMITRNWKVKSVN